MSLMNFMTSRMADSESPNCDFKANENPAQYSCSMASNMEDMSKSLMCLSGIQRAIQILVKFSSFHFVFLPKSIDTNDCDFQIFSHNSVFDIHLSDAIFAIFRLIICDQVASKSFIYKLIKYFVYI